MANQIVQDQLPKRLRDIVDKEVSTFGNPISVQEKTKIPPTSTIPVESGSKWFRIEDVVCVFADMSGSTKLSAKMSRHGLVRAYQLFTGTAVRLFDELDCPYIDVKGDGVFGMFDAGQAHTALAAAVTVKTFAERVFTPRVKSMAEVDVGCHIGIDQKTVWVKKIGIKKVGGRSDRQNEVWAGKPVNMAAKLCSLAKSGEILISDRYFRSVNKDKHVTHSCGCQGGKFTGEVVKLWTDVDLSEDDRFDFDKAYKLGSTWCETHGSKFCDAVIALDKK